MKVLHCPTDTGGNAWALSRAERELGVKSDVMVFQAQRFGYSNDFDLRLKTQKPVGRVWRLGRFFLNALREYDVFHFNFGRSLIDHPDSWLQQLDLPLLRALGKVVFITYQGCDARIKSRCLKEFAISACAECDNTLCTTPFNEQKLKRIKRFQRYADRAFVLNPDLLHSVPDAQMLPYTTVDLRDWVPVPSSNDGRIRIVHAPSVRSVKGTRYVIAAVEALRCRYPRIELMLVENVARDVARKIYEQADIAIDQVLFGWYGGFAVEVMALGKPVLAYLRDEDLAKVPYAEQIPIVSTSPTTLQRDLEPLVAESAYRAQLGVRSRRFVESIHDPLRIARTMIEYYEEYLDRRDPRRRTAQRSSAGRKGSP